MFISPMLLETAQQPFSHSDYFFEPKIDGHRLILSRIDGAPIRLYTRHANECTRQYPELTTIDPVDIILDGEVAATDSTGIIDFESIMERFQLRKSEKIKRAAAIRPVSYVIFDILRLNGEDLRGLPLYKRKEVLADLSLGNPNITKVPSMRAEGERLFEEIAARGMEGIVAKRAESVYVGRRSDAWLKIINWSYAEVIITGYRKGDFGWLTAVPAENGRLRPVGIIEHGVTPMQRAAFNSVKHKLKIGEDRDHVYIDPRLRAKVKIRNWTKAGLLRSPVFVEFIL